MRITSYGEISWYRHWARQWEEPPEDMWCDYGDDELAEDVWAEDPWPDDPWAAAAEARDWHKEADVW